MSIKLNKIPTSLRKPEIYIEYDTSRAAAGLPSGANKVLLLGQKTSAGTAEVNVPKEIYSESDAIKYFGAGSILHQMVAAAITANKYVYLYAMCVADADESVAASGTITVTGPATGAGLMTVNIGNVSLEKSVASGDAAADIASDIADLINNKPALPVSATAAAGVVTLTAKNKGTLGNSVVVTVDNTADGVSAAIVAMTGGLVDPDLTAALTAIQAVRYQFISSPFFDTTALGKLKTHVELVSDPIEQKGGVVVFPFLGTLANVLTLTANYSQTGRLLCQYLRSTKSLPWELSAGVAAIFGFEEDPAKPFDGVAVPGIAAPAIADRLTRAEQETCLHAGITPLEVNSTGEVEIVRAITTYTQNESGVDDDALLDLSRIRVLDYTRDAVRTRLKLRFPQAKLTDKVLSAMATEVYNVLLEEEAAEYVENVEDNKDNILVERDSAAGKALIPIPTDVIDGLHVIAGKLVLL